MPNDLLTHIVEVKIYLVRFYSKYRVPSNGISLILKLN